MGIHSPFRERKDELTRDLTDASLNISELAEKYGVSRQGIYTFVKRMGIKRRMISKHPKECPICQGLIKISRKPRSEFISSQTIREQLGLEKSTFLYHLDLLRKRGLVSKKFGRLRSQKVERAFQIYFKRKLPVSTIGKIVGIIGLWSVIEKHKEAGWDVPAPLFTYDSKERSKRRRGDHLRRAKRKKESKPIGKETGDFK